MIRPQRGNFHSDYSNRIEDIGVGSHSLLLDECNDININKMLDLAIIYFSKNSRQVTSTFSKDVELEACTVEAIFDALKQDLSKIKHDLAKLISTENASVMVRINNGMFAKQKKEIPHLLLFRYLCHSL